MIQNRILNNYVLLLIAFIMGVSCTKTSKPDSVLPSGTMAEVLNHSTAYWASNVAVQRGGFSGPLAAPGPFTGFVVSNYGWRLLGFSVYAGINQTTGTTDTLSRIDPNIMKAIAGYMFVNGKLDTANLPNTVNGEMRTIDGKTLYCTKVPAVVTYSGIAANVGVPYINGHRVTTINIPYPNNGIIQELGEVVLPPIGPIAATIDTIALRKDTTLSLLKASLLKASTATGSGSVNLMQLLAQPGPYTVFAPTNAAFRAYGGGIYNSIEKINALSGPALDLLNRHLQFHIVAQRLFSSYWINFSTTANSENTVATILPGKAVNILGNNVVVGNNIRANIAPGSGGVEINRTCDNGVIHKISAFLKAE
ncbi:MAG: fasciclin domain-containing protein [Niabella sp.]|nr:fasciclin domain-containing protein [Niabella sp.]